MATVIHRRGRYYVVYNYKRQDGSVKQKWETYKTRAEADARKKEVEYKQSIGTFKVKECKTLNDLLSEYVTLYGKENWAPSTYTGNIALIEHYIQAQIKRRRHKVGPGRFGPCPGQHGHGRIFAYPR